MALEAGSAPPPRPLEPPTRPSLLHRALPLLMVCLEALWLLSLVRSTLSNGDAACYLSQILQGDISSRTVHLGYILLATPWVRLLPMPPALALNLLSAAAGLGCLVCLNRLERQLDPDTRWPLASLILLGCAPVLGAFTTAELYAPQAALLLAALLAHLAQRPLLTGLLWGAALTLSPSSLLLVPLLWLAPLPRRHYFPLFGSALALWLAAVAPQLNDYLLGPRGLLLAPPGMPPWEAARYRLSALPSCLGFGLLPLTAGLALIWDAGSPRLRRWGIVLLAEAFLACLLDRYADVPTQGLTLILLALIAGLGLRRLLVSGPPPFRLLLAFLMLAQLLSADLSVRTLRRKEAAFAHLSQQLAAQLPPDTLVYGSWSERRLFEWYAWGAAPSTRTRPWEELPTAPPGSRLLSLPPRDLLPIGGRLRLEADGGLRWLGPG